MTSAHLPANSPKYSTPDGSTIDLMIEHPEFGWIPFTASAQDVEPLGQDLHARAVAGEFDEIAPYDGPSEEEILADQVREQRNTLLAQLDAIISNPLRWASFTDDQQAALATYRQALLDVPQQAGFPFDIDWPVMPQIAPASSPPPAVEPPISTVPLA